MTQAPSIKEALELKPCPFCGGEAKLIKSLPGCDYVKCSACGADSDDTRGVEKWNTRATFQPSGEQMEAIARGLSHSYGEDPDDLAFLTEICGPNNEPLPNWHKYVEQADYLLASGRVQDEAGIRKPAGEDSK